MPKVSVIVPVYNAADYIERCVKSITAQTLEDIEILLINDGSDDNSAEICEELSNSDDRIKFFNQENSGVSSARNKGLNNASGEWVTFVDSDDWIEPLMCEKAVNAAVKADADIVMWSFWSERNKTSIKSHFILEKSGDITIKKNLLQAKMISRYADGDIKGNSISAGATWGKMCRRTLIDENNIRFVVGLTRAQDTVFWLHAFECAKKIEFLNEYLYHYFLSGFSICTGTKYIPDCHIPFEMLMNEYSKFIVRYHNNDVLYINAFYQRAYQVIEWYLKHNFANKQNKKSFFERSRCFKNLISSKRYSSAMNNLDTSILPRSTKILAVLLRTKQAALFMLTYELIENLKIMKNKLKKNRRR